MSPPPAPVLKKPCHICGGDANARNNWRRECSVVGCLYRHLARQYDRVRLDGRLVEPPPDAKDPE